MGINVGTGINAAKKSFFTVGLPMMVGAFLVAILMAILASKAN